MSLGKGFLGNKHISAFDEKLKNIVVPNEKENNISIISQGKEKNLNRSYSKKGKF